MNEVVAKRLQIVVNGKNCIANEVAIVRRTKNGPHWVYLKLTNSCGKTDEYLVDRYNMVQAWIKLEIGEHLGSLDLSNMQVEVNRIKWIAERAWSVVIDQKTFIQLKISNGCFEREIAIDRDGMKEAYYSLRTNVEDIVADGIEAVVGILGI